MENIIVPVLELNDDNHSYCYASKDGFWYNAEEFMEKALCKPHTEEYKIKHIALIELDEEINVDGMDIQDLFGALEFRPDWENMTQEQRDRREKPFDFFWNTPEEEMYEYYRKR